jgi:hypothetical protein
MEEAVAAEQRDVTAGAIKYIAGFAERSLPWRGFTIRFELMLGQGIKGQPARLLI